MKNLTALTCITATLTIALTLTSCAGLPAPASTGNSVSSESRSEPSTPEPTPGALTAEPSEPATAEDADAAFLAYVRAELPPKTSIGDAPDEQLIAAGQEACAQVTEGVAWEDIRLVEGEQPSGTGYYLDTSAILNGALYNYCPELIPKMG